MVKAYKPRKTMSFTQPHFAKVKTKDGPKLKMVKGSIRRLSPKPKVK